MVRAQIILCTTLLAGCVMSDEPGALVPPTVDQDPELPQMAITVAGRTRSIHIETHGDPERPALFLLHGPLSDFRAFRPFRVLSDRYFVVMWDQRGCGLSERITEEEYTWDSVVEEIDALKEAFSPDRPITLIGHSFGAMYAALYTSRRPDNVHQLVLMEPGGLNGEIFTETFDQLITTDVFDPNLNRTFWQSETLSAPDNEALDSKALLILLNGHQTNYWCDRDDPPEYPIWRPGAYVEYIRGLRMGAAGFSRPDFQFDFAVGLETFPRHVLLLGSSCSGIGYDYQVRWHQPLFQDAEVVLIPNAGHRLMVEQLDLVLAAIQEYLDA